MIRRGVSRRASTNRGFGVSAAVHVLLLLLLGVMGSRGSRTQAREDLTEIAYIQARYGEDIAAKVKIKTRPAPPAQESGDQGLRTRSAVKAPASSSTPPTPPRRDLLAEAPAPPSAAMQVRALVEPERLKTRTLHPAVQPIVQGDALRSHLAQASDARPVAAPTGAAAYLAEGERLVGRQSAALEDAEFDVGEDTGGGLALYVPSGGLAEGNPGLTGGSLAPGTRIYQGSVSGLRPAPSGAGRGAGASAIAEVAGPTASAAGNESSGRRTVLDYGRGAGAGNGAGGLGGGRRQLAEAPASRTIVAQSDAAKPKAEIDEGKAVSLGGKGISMTISGQIQGRKILQSAAPQYSAQARRNGWEGVVAVRFTVLPDGRVKDNVLLAQSSAHRDLNQSAMEAIRQFRFAPLPAGEPAVEQWGIITIIFRLK